MDTVAILAYFNFSRKQAREAALQETLKHLNRQVDILLVCYGLPTNAISSIDNIHIITIRSASILWQKERFHRIALSHLRHNHKYIIWMDADILLPRTDWPTQLKDKLETNRLVQLFNRVEDIKLEHNELVATGLIRKSAIASWGTDIGIEDYFNTSGISLRIQCNPGLGWAAKTDTIKKTGFADFMIMGGGDKLLLAAAMGHHTAVIRALSLNRSLHSLSLHWGERVLSVIAGQVSHLENTIYHLVQGDYNKRNYTNRYRLIEDDRFVLDEYLKINKYGAWQWRNADNEYARGIEGYFHDRED
ncbi:MAG: hypothetical protein LGR52_10710 [Candidatus Thiosymbion ectosymbiont of Robbea hypermnestra]|nr:hypothetical protein [Candidatus Thiosymbion ectosymbiont of Robbea hypermnestra]